MRHLFLALTALFGLAGVAQAQTLRSAPDTGTYSPRQATYAAGTTPNVLGDGSNAKGGNAPAFTTHPAPPDPSPTAPAGWLTNTADYCTVTNTGNCPEKKMRTLSGSAGVIKDDPLRYWGQPGVSHCHLKFGNVEANAYSTYVSLRLRNESTAAGGPVLSTMYMEPCIEKMIAGKTYALPATYNVIYYVEGVNLGEAIIDDLQPLHPLLRFDAGVNQDDPDDTKRKAEVAAANAQAGTANRYEYLGNGFHGWACELANGQLATVIPAARKVSTDPGFSKTFNLNGVDPWNGACVDGSHIYVQGDSPAFWDGQNVASLGAFDHFRQGVRDNVTGKIVGPNGWFKVPGLIVKSMFQTRGPADYMTWALSSDAMMEATLTRLGTPRKVLPGESFHWGWMNGWMQTVLDSWLSFGLGIGTNVPHELNSSAISATQSLLLGNSPDGKRKPQVDAARQVNTNDPTQLHLVDTTRPSHVNMRGM